MVTTYCQLSDEGGNGAFLFSINIFSVVEPFWLTTAGSGRLDWDLLIAFFAGFSILKRIALEKIKEE